MDPRPDAPLTGRDRHLGPDPAIGRTIEQSLTYDPSRPDSPVLGRCPQPATPTMPAPVRVAQRTTVEPGNSYLDPAPASEQPKVSAASVWQSFLQSNFAPQPAPTYQMLFGNYSAQTPARMNADGSTTPLEQDVPVWVIEANAVTTAYGTCGMSVIAPYDARTGGGLFVEESG